MARREINRAETIITMLIVALLAVLLFSVCYQLDNKYTYKGVQANNGALAFGEESPMTILVDGWEFYHGVLLTPEDFGAEHPAPRYIFIGQFGGFEAGGKAASPYGSATYGMAILLPEEPASYTLELPEIYSSYKLYLNGDLAAQMGSPEQEGYFPQTGSTMVGVQAGGRLEILLAVSDYSHIYSGLTYPPTFGRASAVVPFLAAKNVARESVAAVSLAMAVFFIIVGLLLKNKKTALLYGLFCFSFFGSIVVPVLKSLYSSGLVLYSLEQFFYRLMLLVILLFVLRISGQKGVISKIAVGFAAVCTLTALIIPSLAGAFPPLIGLYSALTSLYKWACAVYFTVSLLWSALQNRVASRLLLAGVLIFDVALIADRLLPMYEPMRFFWFSEWAGLAFLVVLGMIVAKELLFEARQNVILKEKPAVFDSFIELQNSYYPVLLEQIKDAQGARHDLRHHLRLIRQLAADGKAAELRDYLGKCEPVTSELLEAPITNNYVLNVLLRHFEGQAVRENIQLELLINLPDKLSVEDIDLCILLSNLMENAVEACGYVEEDDRRISLEMKLEKAFLVVVKNSYDGTLHRQGETILSRKRNNTSEGVGIRSVCELVKKNDGAASFSENEEKDEFSAKIIIRNGGGTNE